MTAKRTESGTEPVSDSSPATAARCESWCDVAGTQTDCDLPFGHEHEHEANVDITVWGADDVSTKTNFIAWWGDDGHAFVGSDKAVNTGRIT